MKSRQIVVLLLGAVLFHYADARGIGRQLSCSCAAGEPVCGEDGKTHPGRGCAFCANTRVKCEGECPCPEACVCIQISDPVCGVDGRTYGNPCGANCRRVDIACKGECPCEPVGCPEVFAPVCGVDGVTYDNDCFADLAGIPKKCDGKCPCRCTKGIASCFARPCAVTTCPAFPNAQCFEDFCGGCNAIFVADGKIVNCGSKPPPPLSTCVLQGGRCNAFEDQFPDALPNVGNCCPGLECCPQRSATSDESSSGGALTVTTPQGVCRRKCP